MARKSRIEYAGASYHVINRGNYRQDLFRDEGAAEAFERTLGEATKRFGWSIHAYVVMSNHFHLAVELREPNLSMGMKWLQGTWVSRYNRFRRLIGRPFQGRYKALLVEPGHALGQVCHYIHLNPVRAGLVIAGELESYRWSSLPKFMGRQRPAWLEASVVLGDAGELPDSKKGWVKYRQYLEFLAEDEPSQKELAAKHMSQGWCVGGREFKAQIKHEMALRGTELELYAGLAPEAVRAVREDDWEVRLQALASVARIRIDDRPAQKSYPDKVRLAAALKQSSSVTNGWLAARLGMGKPASASQFVRRYLLTLEGRESTALLLSQTKS